MTIRRLLEKLLKLEIKINLISSRIMDEYLRIILKYKTRH